jgi:DNA-binding NarL/FixJ family response regulator
MKPAEAAAGQPAVVTDVLVVDDHQLVRSGLMSLLSSTDDLRVVGEAADGRQAVRLAHELAPDVVLMDLSMPGMDGVQATREVLSARPSTAVVALTSFADQRRVVEALAAGAVGYLLKDCDPQEVLAGVRAAAAGHAPIDPRVARALLPGGAGGRSPAEALSHRELEVLRLVSHGLANKQIGRRLGISERTVKVHMGNVFKRIGVSDRTSAALWARDHLTD